MPRDQMTKGCSMCAFGKRPCVTPQACTNPHTFKDDEKTVLIGRLIVLLFALLLLIVWWRAA